MSRRTKRRDWPRCRYCSSGSPRHHSTSRWSPRGSRSATSWRVRNAKRTDRPRWPCLYGRISISICPSRQDFALGAYGPKRCSRARSSTRIRRANSGWMALWRRQSAMRVRRTAQPGSNRGTACLRRGRAGPKRPCGSASASRSNVDQRPLHDSDTRRRKPVKLRVALPDWPVNIVRLPAARDERRHSWIQGRLPAMGTGSSARSIIRICQWSVSRPAASTKRASSSRYRSPSLRTRGPSSPIHPPGTRPSHPGSGTAVKETSGARPGLPARSSSAVTATVGESSPPLSVTDGVSVARNALSTARRRSSPAAST